MGLRYCANCNALEQETIIDDDGYELCAYCDEEITKIPEHDDYDMER